MSSRSFGEGDDLDALARGVADEVGSFIRSVSEIAHTDEQASAVALLLLAVSQVMLTGGRLGAISDVVPQQRFEPDAGPDADVEHVRAGLARLLAPVDEYQEVFDPYGDDEIVTNQLSDDIADVLSDLSHGLMHFHAGRPVEALWWWQFSYLSNWGSTASSALRALHSIAAHARLDA